MLTEGAGPAMPRPVGRKQINHEQMPARLPAGTITRIVAVLLPSESKSDFLRAAVEAELTRREREKPKG